MPSPQRFTSLAGEIVADRERIELQRVVVLNEARRGTGDQRTVLDVFQRSDIAGFLPTVRGHALIDVVAFEVRILDLADQRRVVALSAEFVKERGEKRDILPAGVQTEGTLRPRLPVADLDLVGGIPAVGDRTVGTLVRPRGRWPG